MRTPHAVCAPVIKAAYGGECQAPLRVALVVLQVLYVGQTEVAVWLKEALAPPTAVWFRGLVARPQTAFRGVDVVAPTLSASFAQRQGIADRAMLGLPTPTRPVLPFAVAMACAQGAWAGVEILTMYI